MALGQKRNQPLIREAGYGLENLKYETAEELAINPEWKTGYWGGIAAKECGAVGGHMVRRMIAAAEQSLINQATSQVQTSFRSAVTASGTYQLEPDAMAGTTSMYSRYGRI